MSFRLAILTIAASAVTFAQTDEPAITTDEAWEDLMALFSPSEDASAGESPATDQTREQLAAHFLYAGDQAKAYREQHPNEPVRVAEAGRLEAMARLNAVLAGDSSAESSALALAEEVKNNSTLAARDRLEVAKLAEFVRNRNLTGDPAALSLARQSSARRLIEAFPNESAGYEALLNEAQNAADDATVSALAAEVVASPAPEGVKQPAQALLDRQRLVGRSLTDIAAETLGNENVISAGKGRVIVLYTWATWSPGSIERAKSLMILAPEKPVLVGVNLDDDVEAARAAAQDNNLPGEMIYDARGVESPLAQALQLGRTLPIYLAATSGEIRSVSAERTHIAEAVRNTP